MKFSTILSILSPLAAQAAAATPQEKFLIKVGDSQYLYPQSQVTDFVQVFWGVPKDNKDDVNGYYVLQNDCSLKFHDNSSGNSTFGSIGIYSSDTKDDVTVFAFRGTGSLNRGYSKGFLFGKNKDNLLFDDGSFYKCRLDYEYITKEVIGYFKDKPAVDNCEPVDLSYESIIQPQT